MCGSHANNDVNRDRDANNDVNIDTDIVSNSTADIDANWSSWLATDGKRPCWAGWGIFFQSFPIENENRVWFCTNKKAIQPLVSYL